MKLRVATWNMAHQVNPKERAWEFLRYELAPNIALVQEAFAPDSLGAGEHFIYPDVATGTVGACGVVEAQTVAQGPSEDGFDLIFSFSSGARPHFVQRPRSALAGMPPYERFLERAGLTV